MERHPLDVVSLTAGLVFTLAALVALTGAVILGVEDLRWIGPGLLVLFGVVLVATSVSGRGDGRDDSGRDDSGRDDSPGAAAG